MPLSGDDRRRLTGALDSARRPGQPGNRQKVDGISRTPPPTDKAPAGAGGPFASPAPAPRSVRASAGRRSSPSLTGELALRAYLSAGTHKAAADALGVDARALRATLSRYYRRLGVSNAAQAAYLLDRPLVVDEIGG